MDQMLLEYIRSLIPKDFPDGRKVLQEGIEMGHKIKVSRTKFLEKTGARTYYEYRKQRLAEGKQTWQILIGLATLEDEIEALKKLDQWNKDHEEEGMEISAIQSIPSQIIGLPHEYWDKFPKQTSYEMYNPEDWKAHTNTVPIQCAWQDFHLACPASLQTTINALEAGTDRLGCFSTLNWDYTGYYDEVNRFSDMVRSLGIVSTKKDIDLDIVTYPEDGLPGYFMDVVSWFGYEMVEEYIAHQLCGCKFSISYGGLLTDVQLRMAFALAWHKRFSTEDHCAVVYFNGGTVDQIPKTVNCNYGTGVPEMMMQVLFNLHYNTPIVISPVSVTECLRTPSFEELIDITAAGIRTEVHAKEWLPLIDWKPIEDLADVLIEKGTKFYQNVMRYFEAAGVDMKDPLQMIMMLRRFEPIKFETSFHPSIQEFGEFRPYCASQLGQTTMEMKENIVADLQKKGIHMNGEKVVCISADGHSYGLMLIDGVYSAISANVINGGADVEASAALDLADEEGADIICISSHCGQALSYANQIMELAKERSKKYRIVMGGMLNGLLPGSELPVDVADLVKETGVCGTNDFAEQVEYIQTGKMV